MNIDTNKKVEIFSGTGGVGKTTLATARANYLAQHKHRVLLITIDPAKRLKEVLGLKNEDEGKVIQINDLTPFTEKYSFDALLMSPPVTFQELAQKTPGIVKNRIISILTKPYGGMNEILSIVELQKQLDKGIYDIVVLDTPPGTHFLDFLDSSEKIKTFFDQTFVDIFNHLTNRKSKVGIFGAIVSTGLKKLLDYLQSVTGASFIEEFMNAVASVYETKDIFLRALKLQESLKRRDYSNWFLVTSVEQNKVQEALELQKHAKQFIHEDNYIILNKVQEKRWLNWSPIDPHGEIVKNIFVEREKHLKSEMRNKFDHVLEFDEVLHISPKEHVAKLTDNWSTLINDL